MSKQGAQDPTKQLRDVANRALGPFSDPIGVRTLLASSREQRGWRMLPLCHPLRNYCGIKMVLVLGSR